MLPLTEVRARVAAALAPVSDTDPEVLVDVVDSLTPPAILLVWDDPWLEPQSFGPCLWDANLSVLCVAARIEPGPGVEKLEQLIGYVISRLQADEYTWPQASSGAPRIFPIANLPYLGARVNYRVPVSIEGGT